MTTASTATIYGFKFTFVYGHPQNGILLPNAEIDFSNPNFLDALKLAKEYSIAFEAICDVWDALRCPPPLEYWVTEEGYSRLQTSVEIAKSQNLWELSSGSWNLRLDLIDRALERVTTKLPANKPVKKHRKTVIQHAPALAERDGGWFCAYCKSKLVPTSLGIFSYGLDHNRCVTGVRLDNGKQLKIEPGHRIAAVDHKIAVARGGTHELSNLVLACELCNSRKGAKSPEEYLEWLAVRS